MSRRLVTVAVYDLPPLAHIARETLEAEGVRAIVTDDQMVGMDWLLSTAIGGVKVQVWEEDAERAVRVLESVEGHTAADESRRSDPTEEEVEAGDEPSAADFMDEPVAEPAAAGSAAESRDRTARRAFYVGWIGLAFCPLTAYAFYLCLNATFGPGPLSPRGRFELAVAWTTTLLGVFFANLVFYFILRPDV